MKKVLLSLAALAVVACLASCKKVCECDAEVGSFHYEYTIDQLNDIYGDISSCSDVYEASYQTMKCE